MKNNQQFIEHKAYLLRHWSLIETSQAGSGHPTSCLSAADIVATLFFHVMHYAPTDPTYPDNDRFILSKGHASALLYAAWKEVGLLTEQDLLAYRTAHSALEGHPTPRFAPALVATGSLGMGLANGVGMGIVAKKDQRPFTTYVLMGDAELAEGSVWEAAQLAAHYHLDNVVAIVDCNGLGQSTEPMYDHDTARYAKIFEAFGWHTLCVDGHDVAALMTTFEQIKQIKDKPCAIIAHTVKGYGLTNIEGLQGYHGKAFNNNTLNIFLTDLATRFARAADYKPDTDWQPPKPIEPTQIVKPLHTKAPPQPTYQMGQLIATREAFGQALAASEDETIMVLDGDVKNSTFTQLFEDVHATQFVECFIAEQAMVSVANGMSSSGKIPFVVTFGSFLTRAHDQIRLAAIGKAALRVVGSHAGVSIGQDGPSQMALEDIAMMRCLVDSVVLYPADAVATAYLVNQMIAYNNGISYLRLTRQALPVLYKNEEEFPIGGCKVLRQSAADSACIIGAGITLFEALKAYDVVKKQTNKTVSVIDLYSIKPLDIKTVAAVVKASDCKVVVVEDHYAPGGIGEALAAQLYPLVPQTHMIRLAIEHIPGSAKPEEQCAMHHIDANAIIKALDRLW